MAVTNETVLSTSSFEVTVTAEGGKVTFPSPFSTFSGGSVAMEASRYRDAADRKSRILKSLAVPGDVTVGGVFKTDDVALFNDLAKVMNSENFGVTIQPLDGDNQPVGDAIQYLECALTSITPPPADIDGSDVARMELTFMPNSMR